MFLYIALVTLYIFFLITQRPQKSTLFPYTTLFRSVSAHAGQEVAVKGTWESGGGSNSSAASSGSSGKTFNVASVDMISDNCSGKKGSSGNMGTSSPGGTGQSSGGTSTQPPPQ